jgi:nitrate reductase molybdenum cofactor assembly chaperone
MSQSTHYTRLAALFSYPDAEYGGKVQEVQSVLDKACPGASAELKEFTEFASRASLIELEELFTRSFDVQAITTLDLGYVLFGDDYKRGEVLVNLNGEYREVGIDCGSELPDHLPNVLRLLDSMQKPELRAELVKKIIVAPALRRIIGEFDPEKLNKKNAVYKKHHKTLIDRPEQYGTFYQKPLRALYKVLEQDFDVAIDEKPVVPRQSRFLNSIGTEMTLECNKGKCHGSPQ